MAAIVEALSVVRTALEGAGLNTETDRQDDDGLDITEFPCIALSWGGATLSEVESCDTYFWDATIILDCWQRWSQTTPTINGCDALAASAAAALRIDRTFGGKFMRSSIIAVGDLAAVNSEVGSIPITMSVMFQTAKGDWTTISS